MWHQLHVPDEDDKPRTDRSMVVRPEPKPGERGGGQQGTAEITLGPDSESEIEATPELEEAMRHVASGVQRGRCWCGQGHSL